MNQRKIYPIPALAQQIELEWTEELAEYCDCAHEEVVEKVREWFSLPTGAIKIKLLDESCVESRWAFLS